MATNKTLEYKRFHDAVQRNDIGMVESMLDSNTVQVNAQYQGASALYYAATATMAELLLQHKADPDARHATYDETPMHRAARHCNAKVTRVLIKVKANVNAINGGLSGNTPLHLAVQNNPKLLSHGASWRRYLTMVQLLVINGADPNQRNVDGETPLELCSKDTFFRTDAAVQDAMRFVQDQKQQMEDLVANHLLVLGLGKLPEVLSLFYDYYGTPMDMREMPFVDCEAMARWVTGIDDRHCCTRCCLYDPWYIGS